MNYKLLIETDDNELYLSVQKQIDELSSRGSHKISKFQEANYNGVEIKKNSNWENCEKNHEEPKNIAYAVKVELSAERLVTWVCMGFALSDDEQRLHLYFKDGEERVFIIRNLNWYSIKQTTFKTTA